MEKETQIIEIKKNKTNYVQNRQNEQKRTYFFLYFSKTIISKI